MTSARATIRPDRAFAFMLCAWVCSVRMARTNLASFVDDFAARGDEIAFVHWPGLRPVRWSYARLAQACWRFAGELESRGIGHGDRVVIWGRNSPEWVVAFYGALLRGAVAVPLDDGCAADFALRVANQVVPKLLVGASGRSLGNAIPALGLDSLEDEIGRHPSTRVDAADLLPSDLAQIVFTSGTTAEPRGVVITHANVLSNLEPLEREIAKYMKWERVFHPIRFLDLLPLSHVFGQFMGIYVPQLLGGEVHFAESLNPSKIVETIRRERISVCVAVPRILQSLQSMIERDAERRGELEWLHQALVASEGQHPLRKWWRFRRVHREFGWKFWAFVAGGATLEPDVELFWRQLGYAVVQGYGMTETASLVSVNHPFKMSRGSIGKVMPGQELKLGQGGEILVRGGNVTPGYWSGGEAAERVDDGWFPTGDIGELDADGNLFFKGRKKTVIVTASGLNIYPEDLEAALRSQPEIRDSMVVEIEGTAGPEPAAAVIADDADGAARAVGRANATLADYQQIRTWAVWPDRDFPRTSTQKIRRPAVVEFMRARAAGRTVDAGPDALTELLARVSQSSSASVGAKATLGGDLGLDSLARVELLSALEDRYQVDIDESAFTAATTVGDLENLLTGRATGTEPPPHRYPRWPQWWWVRAIRLAVLYGVILPLAFVMCRCAVRGRDRLASLVGPVIFMSNHVVRTDAGLILSVLPGRFRRNVAIAMSGEMLAEWLQPPPGTGWIERLRLLAQYVLVLALFNVFPLPQRTGFRRSFAFAGELVDRGYSVLVFPEGARTPDGEIHAFRSGAGILADELGVPVVPVRIHGLYEVKLTGRKFVKPGAVTIAFGEPIEFEATDDPGRSASLIEAAVRSL